MRLRQRTDELLKHISPDMQALAANNMVLIGHSMGGIISNFLLRPQQCDLQQHAGALIDTMLQGLKRG